MADWGVIEKAGEFAWTVLKDGKPTAEAHSAHFRAVPQGVDFTQLENAQNGTWSVEFWSTNLYGVRVVDLKATVHFEYGATYKGGGAFLPSIMVEAAHVSVLWGFSLDFEAHFGDPTNVSQEHNKPIAAVQLNLVAKISSFLKTEVLTVPVEIRGDGQVIPL
jgi:hypothetical protein